MRAATGDLHGADITSTAVLALAQHTDQKLAAFEEADRDRYIPSAWKQVAALRAAQVRCQLSRQVAMQVRKVRRMWKGEPAYLCMRSLPGNCCVDIIVEQMVWFLLLCRWSDAGLLIAQGQTVEAMKLYQKATHAAKAALESDQGGAGVLQSLVSAAKWRPFLAFAIASEHVTHASPCIAMNV